MDKFDQMSWHDNAIHGFRIIEGPENAFGQLVLDIDFIEEWLQNEDGSFSFKVVPSDLIFNDVSDLVVSIDYASVTAAVQPMTIGEISREPISYPNGQGSYKWTVDINWPSKSSLKFEASGFKLSKRMASVTTGAQYLSPKERGQ